MLPHIKLGLRVALLFTLLAMPIGLLSWHNSLLRLIGAVLTVPAWPVLTVLAHFIPPPLAEAEISSWDYLSMTVGVLASAIIYGVAAFSLSYYLRPRPRKSA